jgi:Flp pilus assembly protein TadD
MREPYSPARRAYAAALVQLGRKEEAEQEYRRHLRAHDGDTRARRELKALIMGSLGEGR